jgi:2'-5' RNA ligase
MDAGVKTQQSFFNGGTQREYRLVIYPDTVVYNKIMAEKQRFFVRYGVESVIKSFPYIMVGGFCAGEGMEETLIRWLQRIFSQHSSFEIMLNNFSGFPQHSIYLRVQNPQPLQKLAHELKSLDNHVYIRSSLATERWPHCTLAGDLSDAVYARAMPVYSRKTFHAGFMANEVVLLARDHPFAAFKTITVFRFLPANHKSYSEVA